MQVLTPLYYAVRNSKPVAHHLRPLHPTIIIVSHQLVCNASYFLLTCHQASQLGVYKAFVDNYKVALETAEKCSQANIQFQKISEVSSSSEDKGRM